jgi:biopolymer transport protein TolR
MARRPPLTAIRPMGEINMTPLIDMMFLLLVTFIITFPLVEQGIPVNLPQGKAKDLTEQKRRTLTVDETGSLFLDNVPVTLDQLRVGMSELGRSDPNAVVMVRADEKIIYGKLVKVLKVLHDAKITKMALVTRADEP